MGRLRAPNGIAGDGESDKAAIMHGYDTLMSRVYEFLTRWFLGPFIKDSHQTLLQSMGMTGRTKVLDVGCGTGTLMKLIGRVDPKELMVGLDFSIGMLGRAQRKLREAGLENESEFVLGDAEAMPFRDDSFAACTCTGTLRFLPHPAAALREACRVLGGGGLFGLREMAGGDEPRRIRHIPLPFKNSFVAWRLLPDRWVMALLRGVGFEGVSSFRRGTVPQFIIAMGPPLRRYVFFIGNKPALPSKGRLVVEPIVVSLREAA